MPWKIPDKASAGVSPFQSAVFAEYMDALVDGINGKNCVLSGGAVTGNANLAPSVAKCAVLSNGVLRAVAANTVTIGAAHASLPRIDLIVVDSSGALQVRAGTAAAFPSPPARTANDVLLAAVYVPATATSLATANCVDLRVLREQGPITIYKTTAAETTNTTAAAVHILNKAGSGVVIPNGLFLAGKQLRVRIGGNVLMNSGTPTLTLAITYGGTTIFADVTGAATADTDRSVFFLDFTINAQANNDQAMVGVLELSPMGSKTAPTNGLGDVALTTATGGPIAGAAAIDSDAGNNTLAVTLTMSVSNVANEIVTEFASIELV